MTTHQVSGRATFKPTLTDRIQLLQDQRSTPEAHTEPALNRFVRWVGKQTRAQFKEQP